MTATTRRVLLGVLLMAAGCTGTDRGNNDLSLAELKDPESCQECHPDHYREWSGSMHAYAAEDPVFLAMNARGQRETNGALGDFCVSCHAPIAVREGLTTDGLDLADLPAWSKGVTCWFCHSVESVDGTHNAALTLAGDRVLRGGIADPKKNTAHRSAYSPLHDRDDLASSSLCGSCHDIVTPNGLHLERTFVEWQASVFSHPGPFRSTCGNCHLRGRDGIAADYPGVPLRRVHDHSMPGVDLALTEWPEADAQRALVQASLDDTLIRRLCVIPNDVGGADIVLRLENVAAGHRFPSGASQDRRLWPEVTAWVGTAQVFATGVVAEGEAVADSVDPELWLFRDRLFDGSGDETHMFWEALTVQTNQLPATVTLDPLDPAFFHYVERAFDAGPGIVPDRVTARVRLEAVGLDVIDDLIASGDLDASFRPVVPVFDLGGSELVWTGPLGTCVP